MVYKGFYKLVDYNAEKGITDKETNLNLEKIVCASKVNFFLHL